MTQSMTAEDLDLSRTIGKKDSSFDKFENKNIEFF
jgi:hypothetical protein